MNLRQVRDFAFYWLPVIAYMGVIFYFSSMSRPPVPGVGFKSMDLFEHAAEYLVLSLLLFRAAVRYEMKNAYTFSIIVATIYGATDEIHQLFVPGRFFSITDIVADAIGALFVLLFKIFRK